MESGYKSDNSACDPGDLDNAEKEPLKLLQGIGRIGQRLALQPFLLEGLITVDRPGKKSKGVELIDQILKKSGLEDLSLSTVHNKVDLTEEDVTEADERRPGQVDRRDSEGSQEAIVFQAKKGRDKKHQITGDDGHGGTFGNDSACEIPAGDETKEQEEWAGLLKESGNKPGAGKDEQPLPENQGAEERLDGRSSQ